MAAPDHLQNYLPELLQQLFGIDAGELRQLPQSDERSA